MPHSLATKNNKYYGNSTGVGSAVSRVPGLTRERG